jgi:ribosome-associated translation inhibitor RaiA
VFSTRRRGAVPEVLVMLPVDVVFRNLQRSEAIEARIRAKADELAVFDPRLQQCRAVVELPHRHQKHGDRFLVRLTLSVPGSRDVIIEHGPGSDVYQVVHDAFAVAERRLTASAQKRRREVKTHGPAFDAGDLWH